MYQNRRRRFSYAGVVAVAAVAGCDGEGLRPNGISELQATVSEVIPTVVTVSWKTDTALTGHVVFGASGELSTPEETVASTEHSAILLGLPASTDAEWTVVMSDGHSETGVVNTGTLPNTLPSVTATGTHDEYTVTSVLGGVTGPAILDPQGRFVWFYPDSHGLDVYRARLARDGKSVLYNAANVSGTPSDSSVIVRVSLDGTEESEIPVPLLAHDFVEMEDGSIVAMAVEFRDAGSDTGDTGAASQIRGDKLVQIAPDGTQTDLWSSWDCFDPATDIGTDQDAGWTFANSLEYDATSDGGSGAFELSLRNFSSITHIPRVPPTSGSRCDWTFGTTAATVTPDVPFLHSHQFQLLHANTTNDVGSMLIFDNAGMGNASRAIEYSFDPAQPVAHKIWEYDPSPSIFTFVLGDVARLDGGDTVVDFAVSGEIDRVTPAGAVAWRVNTALGYGFGFMTQTPSLYSSP